ncbi:hypothetical protein [Glaciecola sp. SC05]|uniref:hypothetical protein n=1 Tax=Glaciecola sp. SC05 TaxID=1987355 RepID=UPI00352918F2
MKDNKELDKGLQTPCGRSRKRVAIFLTSVLFYLTACDYGVKPRENILDQNGNQVFLIKDRPEFSGAAVKLHIPPEIKVFGSEFERYFYVEYSKVLENTIDEELAFSTTVTGIKQSTFMIVVYLAPIIGDDNRNNANNKLIRHIPKNSTLQVTEASDFLSFESVHAVIPPYATSVDFKSYSIDYDSNKAFAYCLELSCIVYTSYNDMFSIHYSIPTKFLKYIVLINKNVIRLLSKFNPTNI